MCVRVCVHICVCAHMLVYVSVRVCAYAACVASWHRRGSALHARLLRTVARQGGIGEGAGCSSRVDVCLYVYMYVYMYIGVCTYICI